MFDVVWANPNRELVGQRKARKEKEKEQRDTCSSGGRSTAPAETETSSLRNRKPQSFLESIRFKKKRLKQDAPSVSTSSRLSGLSDTAGNRDSVLAPPSLASSLGRSASVQYRDSSGDGTGSIASGQQSSSQNRSSLDVDSILSKWTIPNSLATMLSVDEEMELELRTQNGKKTTSIKTTGSDIVQTVLRLRIDGSQEVSTPSSRGLDNDRDEALLPHAPPLTPMASPQKPSKSPLTPSSLASSRRKKKRVNPPDLKLQARHTLGKPIESFGTPDMPDIRPLSVRNSATSWNARSSWENKSLPSISLPTPLKVGIKTPRSPKSPSNTIRSSSRAATEETSPSSVAAQEDDRLTSLSLSLSGIQKEIQKMASADSETFWKRLTEQWGTWADAALYKALEMDRKRWLLSALYSINPAPDAGIPVTNIDRRILAFFETQATASYIAALNAGTLVHHMSPSPLSNNLFPNVVPVLSPAFSCTSLSASPLAFSDIYVQPLPALVSASDIPLVLRNMHRALTPQGTLHLLLIDPTPARSATGPRLQAWLDEHLLLNLERQFRCTSPTRLFPTWLRDAHFQLGAGSKVVCPFSAVFKEEERRKNQEETQEPQQPPPQPQEQASQESPIVPEDLSELPSELSAPDAPPKNPRRLQSLVGQKLWQEIWGPYVTANKWWWEDEACREECLRLETVWEYHIVDAVKKERYVASQL
ncbi:uncharacterized protein SPSK_05003 [Sporothrix schenckii 1099-18]|uniref:Methyltransferase type 11 domain-containing protein n=1 Tax=Sporothrix schenckii 1099-18 TaxID=1397361 RepID=A0A0F2LV98_SPOSC|nr:uncharacterized protein SPSK_05003 [Sporothrix schenckii 1099-18]KJR80420.1 hypothetical protein SPSK_05003 [Sporothrix schenckii 1099-18]